MDQVPSEPEDLVRCFEALERPVARIGLEAGALSQWLHAGLVAAGFEAVLLETRHVKAALSAMTVKTDRPMHAGWPSCSGLAGISSVHAESVRSQEVRALLTARN